MQRSTNQVLLLFLFCFVLFCFVMILNYLGFDKINFTQFIFTIIPDELIQRLCFVFKFLISFGNFLHKPYWSSQQIKSMCHYNSINYLIQCSFNHDSDLSLPDIRQQKDECCKHNFVYEMYMFMLLIYADFGD